MLTGCTVDGQFLARVCVLSFRTRRSHVETAVDQIIEEAQGLRNAAGHGLTVSKYSKNTRDSWAP